MLAATVLRFPVALDTFKTEIGVNEFARNILYTYILRFTVVAHKNEFHPMFEIFFFYINMFYRHVSVFGKNNSSFFFIFLRPIYCSDYFFFFIIVIITVIWY